MKKKRPAVAMASVMAMAAPIRKVRSTDAAVRPAMPSSAIIRRPWVRPRVALVERSKKRLEAMASPTWAPT